MQDEWDRFFPIEQNDGELNIPDFDLNNFTGGYESSGLENYNSPGIVPSINLPLVQNTGDVNFGSALQRPLNG